MLMSSLPVTLSRLQVLTHEYISRLETPNHVLPLRATSLARVVSHRTDHVKAKPRDAHVPVNITYKRWPARGGLRTETLSTNDVWQRMWHVCGEKSMRCCAARSHSLPQAPNPSLPEVCEYIFWTPPRIPVMKFSV